MNELPTDLVITQKIYDAYYPEFQKAVKGEVENIYQIYIPIDCYTWRLQELSATRLLN